MGNFRIGIWWVEWVEGRPVAFLPRHEEGHRIMASEINFRFRASIYGFRKLGTE